MEKIRVFIVDDAVVVRRMLSSFLASDPELEVVGTAVNGRDALSKLTRLKPDLVILDIEMPEMNGLETLEIIQREYPKLPVIMFSTITTRGAAATLEALALGAKDYVTKPEGSSSPEAALDAVRVSLIPKIKVLCSRTGEQAATSRDTGLTKIPLSSRRGPAQSVDIVVIGASTGGPNALAAVLCNLPEDFPVPILVVQHMPPVFTRMLAERLDSQSRLRVKEGITGVPIEPGQVWIAPGDYHMTLERTIAGIRLGVYQGELENSCRPSADALFRSAAEIYGAHTLAVVMTGMGQDGLAGSARIREVGGQVLAQDQASSVVWGMPGSVIKAGLADQVQPLSKMAEGIANRVAYRPSAWSRARSSEGNIAGDSH